MMDRALNLPKFLEGSLSSNENNLHSIRLISKCLWEFFSSLWCCIEPLALQIVEDLDQRYVNGMCKISILPVKKQCPEVPKHFSDELEKDAQKYLIRISQRVCNPWGQD